MKKYTCQYKKDKNYLIFEKKEKYGILTETMYVFCPMELKHESFQEHISPPQKPQNIEESFGSAQIYAHEFSNKINTTQGLSDWMSDIDILKYHYSCEKSQILSETRNAVEKIEISVETSLDILREKAKDIMYSFLGIDENLSENTWKLNLAK